MLSLRILLLERYLTLYKVVCRNVGSGAEVVTRFRLEQFLKLLQS